MKTNWSSRQLICLVFWCIVLQIHASNVKFFESFDEPFEERWIISEKDDYNGEWKWSQSEGHDDYGLLVSEKAKKYAIVSELDEKLSLKDGTIVLQYEVRLQNGLECGGAYLKYLRPQETGWKPDKFGDESPFSIMFGPDKCGSTNKVHFILNHKNPKSGRFIEHHLTNPPSVPSDKLTHVYTAILKRSNELRILVDGEEKRKANFLSNEDFEPTLIPSKKIHDPNDKKPEDWDDRAKIPDPNAVKPDDWDEDAPVDIEDEEAVKPEGWLDDEPEEIDDPVAEKPEDWDDEEDGEWEPPKIVNPKCSFVPGCGEWKRPIKRNPAYKGKWDAPLIENTYYMGIWKPKQIPNPHYFDIDKPDFEPIVAIGIEIWTMQGGILFDNILIATDEKIARSYRDRTWKPKLDVEKEKQKDEEGTRGLLDMFSGLMKHFYNILYKIADIPLLEAYSTDIIDLIKKIEKDPWLTFAILFALSIVISTAIFSLILGREKLVVMDIKNFGANAATSNNNNERGSGTNEDVADGPRKRATRSVT